MRVQQKIIKWFALKKIICSSFLNSKVSSLATLSLEQKNSLHSI
ncbi:hypothetical protein EV05_0627 [Prochlorococcus sp. MIT 0601]|nr:hypothetical protein EV05_0627 [Prochlorococcus sp. MIT 0601]